MQEWVKIASSTIAGLAAGLAAEPIKIAVHDWILSRHIRKVMHREVVRLESEFSMGSAIEKTEHLERASEKLAQFKTDAFDHYFETQRGLFFSDERLTKMRAVLEDLKGFLTDPVVGRRTFHDARAFGLGLIKDSIALKIFDERLIERYRKKHEELASMMVFAGIGELTEDDILPKRNHPWYRLKRRNHKKRH